MSYVLLTNENTAVIVDTDVRTSRSESFEEPKKLGLTIKFDVHSKKAGSSWSSEKLLNLQKEKKIDSIEHASYITQNKIYHQFSAIIFPAFPSTHDRAPNEKG